RQAIVDKLAVIIRSTLPSRAESLHTGRRRILLLGVVLWFAAIHLERRTWLHRAKRTALRLVVLERPHVFGSTLVTLVDDPLRLFERLDVGVPLHLPLVVIDAAELAFLLEHGKCLHRGHRLLNLTVVDRPSLGRERDLGHVAGQLWFAALVDREMSTVDHGDHAEDVALHGAHDRNALLSMLADM